MRICFFLFLIFFLTACNTSNSKKDVDESSKVDSLETGLREPRIEFTLENEKDTTGNFYVTVYPEGEIKGSLILLSGFGELPTQTITDSDIYKYASQSGYITFIPALADPLFLYCDTASQKLLHQFIEMVFTKYKLPDHNFFIGGYSIGGLGAFQYTERAYSTGSQLKQPTGVFGADPPLDLERIYKYMTTTDRPKKHPASEGEHVFTDLIQNVFKTNPRDNPKYFWKISPFAASDPSHQTLKSLVNVPLRVYSDPDINWYIENRYVDYSDLNIIDGAAAINWLRSMGNSRAELIISLGKGRKRNNRQPHSWSIIDGKELVSWMDKIATGR